MKDKKQIGLTYGNIVLIEDTKEQQEAAHKAYVEITGVPAFSHARVFSVQALEQIVNRKQPFDTVCNGILTDMMIGNQPEGLSTALKALAEGVPCVVVSCYDMEDNSGHLPGHVRVGMIALEKLGVPVFLSARGEPKRWREGFEKLGEMVTDMWLKQDSDMGGAVRRHFGISEDSRNPADDPNVDLREIGAPGLATE